MSLSLAKGALVIVVRQGVRALPVRDFANARHIASGEVVKIVGRHMLTLIDDGRIEPLRDQGRGERLWMLWPACGNRGGFSKESAITQM